MAIKIDKEVVTVATVDVRIIQEPFRIEYKREKASLGVMGCFSGDDG
jgi:hypothetical protein